MLNQNPHPITAPKTIMHHIDNKQHTHHPLKKEDPHRNGDLPQTINLCKILENFKHFQNHYPLTIIFRKSYK